MLLMHKRKLNSLLFVTLFFSLFGCASKSNDESQKLSDSYFLDRYKAYIEDIQSVAYPANISEHFTKRRVDQLNEQTNGNITPKDVSLQVQYSYMPISSIKKHFFKLKSDNMACLTVIGHGYRKDPMYVDILFVNQSEFEWRMQKIKGSVFTDGVKPELPQSVTCPEDEKVSL